MGGTTSADPDTYLSLSLPAGAGSATPVSFYAEETISLPYLATVDFLSDTQNIPAASVLHKPVCLTLTAPSGGPVRHIQGLARRLTATGKQGRATFSYTVEIVPQLWFLSQSQDCRIFQHRTAEQILQQIFKELEISPVQFKLFSAPTEREYTTQFNESHYDFIARLMQEEGWFYYFVHDQTSHTLVITDANTPFQSLAQPDLQMIGSRRSDAVDYSNLGDWRPAGATTLGQTELKDYDPTAVSKYLQSFKPAVNQVDGDGARQFFRWPGLTYDTTTLDRRTRFLMEAAEAVVTLVDGNGWHNGFVPGAKFVLANDPVTGASSQEYVIRSVVHHGVEDVLRAGGSAAVYRNTFTAFPSGQTWRELMTIPRPAMHGIYSAVVIGPDKEEIFTDSFGRVKVIFPWDVRRVSTPGLSVWLRVVQPWAGKNWGWQYIPRVGTEVAVAFVDGDVDRPVVAGGLYNSDDMPPFTLPAQKTLSGLETRSTPMPRDGQGNPTGKAGYHLLRFDDAYGNEQLLMRSQARMDVTAKSSMYETVGVGDRHLLVLSGYDKVTNKTVQGNSFNTIGSPHFGIPPYGNYHLHVAGSRFEQVDGTDYGYQLTVKKDMQLDVEENFGAIIKGNLSLNASSIVLEASQKITLKVGSSTVVLNSAGVYLDGAMVYEQCNGPADTSADLTFQPVTDAQAADPGEPPDSRSGGGGASSPGGSRTVPAQHAPQSTTDGDGMLSSPMSQWSGG